jgi:hypothetical protein
LIAISHSTSYITLLFLLGRRFLSTVELREFEEGRKTDRFVRRSLWYSAELAACAWFSSCFDEGIFVLIWLAIACSNILQQTCSLHDHSFHFGPLVITGRDNPCFLFIVITIRNDRCVAFPTCFLKFVSCNPQQ